MTQLMIQKMVAVNLIQKIVKKKFEKTFGINWKYILNNKWTVYELDYYCERNGIMDPWYDYCDHPMFAYSDDTETTE